MIRVLTVRKNANEVNSEVSDTPGLHFDANFGLFWKCERMTQYFGRGLRVTHDKQGKLLTGHLFPPRHPFEFSLLKYAAPLALPNPARFW